ncbi:hypothetical protein E1212_19825 [Jiangella ureilytica]|uniref:Uncharacterized protein n=1 Tax=Jiangella ureilytica TaxID=2530374 RepID=A0A4R4RHH6_9ACTN|nr:hypothetical protein [Jiangella ureilytica]TDC48867.1 hypothetical protein E1212_19825 [Jiangella ureilytica]
MSDDPVGVVIRWEDAGGEWRVVARTATTATVALCRCDGGEEVDRFTSADPALLDFLAARRSGSD